MKALDLFCGAGGATKGLQMAGYEVTGVDINPQPHYVGDHFYQADALTFPLEGYDLIWASPPCQFASHLTPPDKRGNHPDLIGRTRERLQSSGSPYIIENVAGARAHLHNPVKLCGTMFGLRSFRHRFFELSPAHMLLTPPCNHSERPLLVTWASRASRRIRLADGEQPKSVKYAPEALGIDWMDFQGLREAIPPIFSRWLAEQLISSENCQSRYG